MLLVLGEPGIGKSRLLEALAAAAKVRGARVAVGRCFEAETVHPYGCFTDALRELPEALAPDELRGGFVLDAAKPQSIDPDDRDLRQLLPASRGRSQAWPSTARSC